MARAQLKCTCPECGTTHYWQVNCHNRREADSWEEYHAGDTDRLCPECYRKMMAKKREEERAEQNKAAAATAAALNLPALTGTEKQVAWATTIRQAALDGALLHAAGGTASNLNDKGRALIVAVIAKMPAEAKWWIDNRDDAEISVRRELLCANWKSLPAETREKKLAECRAKKAEIEARSHGGHTTNETLLLAAIADAERIERARIAGRTYAEQAAADAAEAEAAKRASEAARIAALPPKPTKLVVRLGYADTARWNGKFYGRDGLRVYIDGNEVQVPAETKSAWEAEWKAYNDAAGK